MFNTAVKSVSHGYEIPKWLKPLLWQRLKVCKRDAAFWVSEKSPLTRSIRNHGSVRTFGASILWDKLVLESRPPVPSAELLADVIAFCELLGLKYEIDGLFVTIGRP